jgi:hypothetical protein
MLLVAIVVAALVLTLLFAALAVSRDDDVRRF